MSFDLSEMHALALKHSNTTQSPLLRLPGELRNKIYHYALGNHHMHLDYSYEGRWGAPTSFLMFCWPAKESGEPYDLNIVNNLPSTCRQLYIETRNLLLSTSDVIYGKTSMNQTISVRWREVEAEQIFNLPCVRIVEEAPCPRLCWRCCDHVKKGIYCYTLPLLKAWSGLKEVVLEWEDLDVEWDKGDWETHQNAIVKVITDKLDRSEVNVAKAA